MLVESCTHQWCTAETETGGGYLIVIAGEQSLRCGRGVSVVCLSSVSRLSSWRLPEILERRLRLSPICGQDWGLEVCEVGCEKQGRYVPSTPGQVEGPGGVAGLAEQPPQAQCWPGCWTVQLWIMGQSSVKHWTPTKQWRPSAPELPCPRPVSRVPGEWSSTTDQHLPTHHTALTSSFMHLPP